MRHLTVSLFSSMAAMVRLLAVLSFFVVLLAGVVILPSVLRPKELGGNSYGALQVFMDQAARTALNNRQASTDEVIRNFSKLNRPQGMELFVFDATHKAVYSSRPEVALGSVRSSWLVQRSTTLGTLAASVPAGGRRQFDAEVQPVAGWRPEPGLGYLFRIPRSGYYMLAFPSQEPTQVSADPLQQLWPPFVISFFAASLASLAVLLGGSRWLETKSRTWSESALKAAGEVVQSVHDRRSPLPQSDCAEIAGFLDLLRDMEKPLQSFVRNEEKLRRAEASARALLNGMDRAVLVLNPAGEIIWANRATEQLFEVSRQALPGTRLSIYSGESGAEKILEEGLRCVSEGADGNFFWSCRRMESNQLLPVEVWAGKISTSSSEGFCVAIHDISARKKQEAEMLRMVRDFQTAMEKAEASERAQRTFLARMSHELRAPLNAMIGLCHLEEKGGAAESANPAFHRIAASARELLRVVDDVLECTKLESGKISILQQPFEIERLILEVKRFCRVRASGRPLHFSIHLHSDLPKVVVGDAGRVKQILINFCENAIKFTQAGVIKVDVIPGIHDAAMIHFRVIDKGIGIPASKQAKLFQEFGQVDENIGRTYGGSGLGLAICKMLVHAMGGRIGVISHEGEGSTFWFEISLPAGVMPSHREETDPRHSPGRQALRGKKILVVDDEDINRAVVDGFLTEAGGETVCCGDGTEAFEKVLCTDFDLLLLDLELPNSDGFRILESIRHLPGSKGRIPAVAMSSHLEEYIGPRVRAAGFASYLTKPVEREKIVDVLQRVLHRPASAGTDSARPEQVVDWNQERGLGRLGGNSELYLAMKQRFIDHWCHDTEFIENVLRTGGEEAIRLAHKLRGAAATLGAEQVADLAGRLEISIRQGGTPEPLINDLLDALHRLTDLLTKSSQPPSPPKTRDDPPNDSFPEL